MLRVDGLKCLFKGWMEVELVIRVQLVVCLNIDIWVEGIDAEASQPVWSHGSLVTRDQYRSLFVLKDKGPCFVIVGRLGGLEVRGGARDLVTRGDECLAHLVDVINHERALAVGGGHP